MAFLVLVGSLVLGAPLILYVYSNIVAQRPRIYAKAGSEFARLVMLECSSTRRVFRPIWWCIWGNLQTLMRQLLRSCPALPFEREILKFKDGGQVAFDWLHPASSSSNDETPIVIVLPGITGSTHDCPYVLHLAVEANRLGYRLVVLNSRGLGGVALSTAQGYNAAWTEDLAEAVAVVRRRYPAAPLLGVGFSMGGMILWNYLAKCATPESSGLTAAMVISAPWNPFDASETIEQFWPNLLFNRWLANNLCNVVRPHRALFENLVDVEQVLQSRTVRQFDKSFIAPSFGYADWTQYYHDAALHYKVHKISVPTLCLNAADDCFSPVKSIPFEAVEQNENVVLVLTRHGGHQAYMDKMNPNAKGLIEELFIEYSTLVFTKLL